MLVQKNGTEIEHGLRQIKRQSEMRQRSKRI